MPGLGAGAGQRGGDRRGLPKHIGNLPVFKRTMKQWKMRITLSEPAAGRLGPAGLADKVKAMDASWNGRSTVVPVTFAVEGREGRDGVFTTHPEEHPAKLHGAGPRTPRSWMR